MPERKRPQRSHSHHYDDYDDADGHYRMLYHGHDAPALGNQVDARYLTLPSIAIIAIVVAGVWTTYTVLQERNRIDNRINSTIEAVKEVANAVRALGENLPTMMEDRYTRTQHEYWCRDLELENAKIGIKCPPIRGVGPQQTRSGQRYISPHFTERVQEGLSRAQQ